MSLIIYFYLGASQNDQCPDNKWRTSFATLAELQTIASEFSDITRRFNLNINGCQIKNIQDLSGHLDHVREYFFDEKEKKEKLIQEIGELHYSNVQYAYCTQILMSTIDVLKNALVEKDQEIWGLKVNNCTLINEIEAEKNQHRSVLIERNNAITQLESRNKILETHIKQLNQQQEQAKPQAQFQRIESLEEQNRELQEQVYNQMRKNNQLKNNLTILLALIIIYGFYYSFNTFQVA